MREILEERIRLWLADEEGSVEYAEEVEGRWAVRMRQETRDATTIWFTIGQRSLEFEAYVLPEPRAPAEVHRQAMLRNARAWRCFFATDAENAIVLRGRLAAERVTIDELDRVLGEVYDTIELSFRPMVRAGFPGRNG